MGRLIGYMANRADRLREALHQERLAVDAPAQPGPAGWGMGFYQGGEILHRKRPLFENAGLDWESIAGDVRADCMVAHLRHATVGDFRAENTHPFRMRSWLFAHSGTIHRFDALRPRLLENLPDFILRNVRGDTDSEAFFHLVLSFLHDEGQLDRGDVDPKTVVAALRAAVRMVDQLGREVGAKEAELSLLLTNGRQMFAVRRGSPMSFVERQGIHDPIDASAPEPRKAQGTVFRYVLISGNGAADTPGYRPLEQGTVCIVDRDLRVELQPL